MRHMLAGENLALLTTRQQSQHGVGWALAGVTDTIAESCAMSNKTREINYVFPLWLYPDEDGGLLAGLEETTRRQNLSPSLLQALGAAHGATPTPEDVFHYIYAVLYSQIYRETYAEFLRLDFPRVPFTADPELFRALAALGERLVGLHLLRSPELSPPLARFEGASDSRVGRGRREGLRYEALEQRVCINETQHFAPVPAAVWEYQIGGFQVCEKWLKDRRERVLTLDEINTYCRIVTALARTMEVQAQIDGLYPRLEETLLEVR